MAIAGTATGGAARAPGVTGAATATGTPTETRGETLGETPTGAAALLWPPTTTGPAGLRRALGLPSLSLASIL